MQFFAGVLDNTTGLRYVLKGTANPTISVTDLTHGGVPYAEVDWGLNALPQSRIRLAGILLRQIVGQQGASTHQEAFANSIIKYDMSSESMWMLAQADIDSWLSERPVSVQ